MRVWLIKHLTTAFHSWQKKQKAVFDMCMGMCVHVRSRFTALLNSGCEVSKQKQKIVFGMDSLGWISSWRKSEQKKKEKSNTCASENRLYRSRIAGNFDTAKSQGATTARTRADGSSLLGLHGHQGDLEEMERTKRTNQKKVNSKENREIGNPPKPKK